MRLVVKIGTNLVTKPDHSLDAEFLKNFVTQIASLHHEGHDLILVSSGAVAAGRGELSLTNTRKNLPFTQSLAAVGQGILIETYRDFFRKFHIPVAQALLTNDDFVKREHFLNIQHVFDLLLEERVIPIVNENDVTTMAELKFGDNDMLSAKTASLISADFLLLLTTVDGVYAEDPRKNPEAPRIQFVAKMDEKLFGAASSVPQAGSMGGMFTKLQAAEYATESGIATFIGNGRKTNILRDAVSRYEKFSKDERLVNEFPGTFFIPKETKQQNFSKWLRAKALKGAKILVDDGAMTALREKGKSLLVSGIRAIEGKFERGDVVAVCNLAGKPFVYGQVNYGVSELEKIQGKKSSDIEAILGYVYEDEAIHRDRMVFPSQKE